MKKFAVLLSGSGVYDGAEIQEAVLTLLAIDKAGASYQCFAPDIRQHHVVNHLTGDVMNEDRNVLIEAARIARGDIKPMQQFNVDDVDALILPGGFGVAKNLCNWAVAGDDCAVDPTIEKAVSAMFHSGKPVGAMCIAPVLLGKIFNGTRFTTGNDPASEKFIKKMGNEYVVAAHGEVVVDRQKKLFTTPCYMLDASISQIAEGTENLVKAMMAAL